MPLPAELRESLLERFEPAWVEHHLTSFERAYFESFEAEAIGRHLELIRALSDERPVVVHTEAVPGLGGWRVEVVGFDAFQFLSTLCTLLTVHGFSIAEGRVFTSEPPPARDEAPRAAGPRRPSLRAVPASRPRGSSGPDRRRKLVDVFRVERIAGGPEAPDWGAFQTELKTLTALLRAGKYDDVHHRLIDRFVAAIARERRASGASLLPIDVSVNVDAAEAATAVRVQAPDSLGFLSLTASALALCGIRIVRADVRTTPEGRIDDTIWVTDRSGHKITEESRLRELRLSLVLIEHFSSRLPDATNPEAALVHFSRFATDTMSRPDWAEEFAALDRPEVLDALVRLLGESDFLWKDFLRDQPETVLPMIADPSAWGTRRARHALAAELGSALAASDAPNEGHAIVQRFKDREIFRVDLRAILGVCDGPEGFSDELTDVAEVLIEQAFAIADAEAKPPSPRRQNGSPAAAVLCALGKFGGHELGFASDLELILVYDDRDLDAPPGKAVGDHFDRMVRALHEVLGVRRGCTFELDFRLRPYGKGGPPATALTSFQNYYQAGGAAWGYERQALIKLRAVAGDRAFGKEVEAIRDRFVYGPEPFDLDGLQRMRQLQIKQLVKPGTISAKYSSGALVDVEYFVQALQIAHGGNCPAVRTTNTREGLDQLEAHGRIDAATASTLRAGQHFCRALIDGLRVVHGRQHDLTVPPDGSEEFQLLARRLRYDGPRALRADVDHHLSATRDVVERLSDYLPTSDESRPDASPG